MKNIDPIKKAKDEYNQLLKQLKEKEREIHQYEVGKQMDAFANAMLADEKICDILHNLTPKQAAFLAKPISDVLDKIVEGVGVQLAEIKAEEDAAKAKQKAYSEARKAKKQKQQESLDNNSEL